jgi:protease-4
LGLEAPLATTDNGSYLNQDQLDQVEARLDNLESENSTLQTSLTEATTAKTTAVESVQSQLTEATNSLTAVTASVDATLAEAGLPVEGTLTEKLTALNSYAAEKGAKDGAAHTNVKRTNDSETEATTVIGGVDISADLNN